MICLVTNRRRVRPDARTLADELAALNRFLDAAIAADIDLIQIRERDLSPRALCAFAAGVATRAAGSGTAVVVNDRADVALAARAGGVHLRSDGPAVDRVRTLAPPGWRIGRSIHSTGDAREHATADYLIFGTTFATSSKPGGHVVQGLEGLRAAAAATETPVLAIGGVSPARARACVDAGAAGFAGIGLFIPRPGDDFFAHIRRVVTDLRVALQ